MILLLFMVAAAGLYLGQHGYRNPGSLADFAGLKLMDHSSV